MVKTPPTIGSGNDTSSADNFPKSPTTSMITALYTITRRLPTCHKLVSRLNLASHCTTSVSVTSTIILGPRLVRPILP